ncbi:MAG TPA: TetR family transcriptional regulator [Victivallales bacterium]|nr:TetR family transcriptional regulator [Victivallales bacterium]
MKAYKKTKEKLIKSAINHFSEKGYEGASIRDIALEADINNTMISYHFGGKKQLYNSCIEYVYAKSNENMITIEHEVAFAEENKLEPEMWLSIFKKMLLKRITFFTEPKSRNLYLFLFRAKLADISSPKHTEDLDSHIILTHKVIGGINKLDSCSPEVIKKSLVITSLIHALVVSEYIVLNSFGFRKYTPKFIDEYIEYLVKEATI